MNIDMSGMDECTAKNTGEHGGRSEDDFEYIKI